MKAIVFLIFLFFLTDNSFQKKMPESFIGEWVGTGILMGQQAEFEMKWESVLDRQFLKLSFQNKISDQFTFKGNAYYQFLTDSTFSGQWFDNRGYMFPLQGSYKDDVIISHWGLPAIEEGRTEYRYGSDGTIQVTDFVLRDGSYQKFGEATYQPKQ